MGFVVRKMKKEDAAAVTAVEAACFSAPWSGRLVEELPESPYDETWVLELGGIDLSAAGEDSGKKEIAGYITFRFLAGEGELMRIAVLPQFRGRGLSRKLMDRLEKSAEEQGISALTLEVRAGNEAAINLYKTYGFQAEAIRKNYYSSPTEDALLMWKRDLLTIPT